MKLSDNGENKKGSANAGNTEHEGAAPPSEQAGLTEEDIILLQIALRTRWDHLEEMIRKNTNGELLASCGGEQNHIQDLKRRLLENSGSSQGVRVEAESQSLPSDVGVQGQAGK